LANDIDPKQTTIADKAVYGNPPASYEEPEDTIILDLLLILSARKFLIFALALIGGVLAGVLAFLVPPTYTATAVIIPPQQQSSSIAAALMGQLGGAAGFVGQSLGIKNPSDPYIGMLSSRTVADELIAQFRLRDVYATENLTDTRKKLASVSHFDSAKYSLIQISVEDQDPKRAADLTNAYVDRLQERNSQLAVTEASQRRLFFERQFKAEKDLLSQAETDLKKTQEQKGIFQVNSQVEAVIRSMAQIRAEVALREVNLQRLRAGATTQNPEVLRQEIELKELRSQLQNLEVSSEKKRAGDPLMPTSMVPSAGLEYARRLREVKYHESLYELLAKQFELAKIDEAKEAPVIQIVDRAIPPDQKTSPRRRLYIALGILFGLVFGAILSLLGYAFKHPSRAKKLAELKKSLWLPLQR
jgi:tyrosine-protein kinase Etk/Wzc